MQVAKLNSEMMKEFKSKFLSFNVPQKKNLIKRMDLVDVPIYVWAALSALWVILVVLRSKMEKVIADAPYDVNKLQFITKSDKSKTE